MIQSKIMKWVEKPNCINLKTGLGQFSELYILNTFSLHNSFFSKLGFLWNIIRQLKKTCHDFFFLPTLSINISKRQNATKINTYKFVLLNKNFF